MSGLPQGPLGVTGLPASILGLGTVAIGMPYGLGTEPPPTDAEAIRLLHGAVDLGIGFIDTAAAYGRSESLIGRAFDGLHGRPTIATKVTLTDPRGRPWAPVEVEAAVADSVERSRRRLRTDVLDLVQVHNFKPEMAAAGDLRDALEASMQARLEAGTVRHWGVSTYGAEAPRSALNTRIETLQVAYSVLDRSLETGVLPACHQRGLGLILRSVFLQGVLTDRRHHLAPQLSPLANAAAAVAAVAQGLGLSLPQVALRFALYEAGAHVTLVGTADERELAADVEAASAGPLPGDAVAALRTVSVDDQRLLNPGTWPAD